MDANCQAWSSIPNDVLQVIFSYLTPLERILLSGVCFKWHEAVNDERYWCGLLLHHKVLNVSSWKTKKMLSFLQKREARHKLKAVVYNEQYVLNQEVYFMMCPELSKKWREYHSPTPIVNPPESVLPYGWMSWFLGNLPTTSAAIDKKLFEVLLFGPGLESPRTSKIGRKFLTADGIFDILCLRPGKVQGIGSGVLVSYQNEALEIITMYSNNHHLREKLTGERRLLASSLFTKSGEEWMLNEKAEKFCNDVSAMIYVIDATELDSEEENVPYVDLDIVLKSCLNFGQPPLGDSSETQNPTSQKYCKKPLLVIACFQNGSPHQSLFHLLSCLKLWKYGIPWHVCLIPLDSVQNMHTGLNWLLWQLQCNEAPASSS